MHEDLPFSFQGIFNDPRTIKDKIIKEKERRYFLLVAMAMWPWRNYTLFFKVLESPRALKRRKFSVFVMSSLYVKKHPFSEEKTCLYMT